MASWHSNGPHQLNSSKNPCVATSYLNLSPLQTSPSCAQQSWASGNFGTYHITFSHLDIRALVRQRMVQLSKLIYWRERKSVKKQGAACSLMVSCQLKPLKIICSQTRSVQHAHSEPPSTRGSSARPQNHPSAWPRHKDCTGADAGAFATGACIADATGAAGVTGMHVLL